MYHYLVCSTYAGSGAATCQHTRCHRAKETEERVAEFVLGLLRNPELLREEDERQAENERRRLRRADREAERLRGVLHADFAGRHGFREPRAPADLCTR